jgi:hypothetical protein
MSKNRLLRMRGVFCGKRRKRWTDHCGRSSLLRRWRVLSENSAGDGCQSIDALLAPCTARLLVESPRADDRETPWEDVLDFRAEVAHRIAPDVYLLRPTKVVSPVKRVCSGERQDNSLASVTTPAGQRWKPGVNVIADGQCARRSGADGGSLRGAQHERSTALASGRSFDALDDGQCVRLSLGVAP